MREAPPALPRRRSATRVILTLLAVGGVALACGTCGVLGVLVAAPDLIVGMLLEDHPLPGRNMAVPPMSPEERQAVADDAADGHVDLTPEQLLRMQSALDPRIDVLELAADPQDRVRLDLSLHTSEQRWFNLHTLATVEMDSGRLSALRVDELQFGTLDLGSWFAGQDVSARVQSRIEEQLATDPRALDRMRAVQKMRVTGGRIGIDLAPGGLEAFAAP